MKLFTAIALTSLLASTASAAPVFPSDRRCILPPACQLIEREGLGCGDIGPGCKGYAVWVADKLRGDAAWFQRVAQGYTEAAWRQGAYDMAGRKSGLTKRFKSLSSRTGSARTLARAAKKETDSSHRSVVMQCNKEHTAPGSRWHLRIHAFINDFPCSAPCQSGHEGDNVRMRHSFD